MPLDNDTNLRDIAAKLARKVVDKHGTYSNPEEYSKQVVQTHLLILWDVIDLMVDALYEKNPGVGVIVSEYFEEEAKEIDQTKLVVVGN